MKPRAVGGPVTGGLILPGESGCDYVIPERLKLQAGEFIVSAKSVREHGADLLRTLTEEKDVD